jgi:poly(beta-D-mannuronate) lyase
MLYLIISFATVYGGEKIFVNNDDHLKSLVSSVMPGDTIVIRDGSFDTDGSVTIRNNGTAENRIVIMAESLNGVQLVNESYFDFRKCSYITLSGFIFQSTNVTAVKLQASHHIRITNNIFSLNETDSRKWVLIGGIWDDPNAISSDNRIDHNIFENKTQPGNFITIDGSPDPVYLSSIRDTIDHNYFRNNTPRVVNEKESIRVGWSELSQSSGYTVIEHNLFEDCNGDPEIISVKTCDNIVRYNTFKRCKGTVSLRHGNRTEVHGNFFFGEGVEGTGGVRLYGDDHLVYNNYFQDLTGTIWDAPITLTNGDYDGGSSLSKHFRINRAKIVFNTLVNNTNAIQIGYTNNGNYSKPPRDVVIANNIIVGSDNDLVQTFTSPINMVWQGNIMHPTGTASLGITAATTEIKEINPQLEFIDDYWRLSSSSPAIDSSLGNWDYVTNDMDGQERDTLLDIGADEFSNTEIIYKPLTPEDVGPGTEIITSISYDNIIPGNKSFILKQNYPNPFNSGTNVEVYIFKQGNFNLEIFDTNGKLVKTVFSGKLIPGYNKFSIEMDKYSSGRYYFRISDGKFSDTRKLVHLK